MKCTNTIAVGSQNPVKVECVRRAFEAVWPDSRWCVEGHKVQTDVSSQPLDEMETITGAQNRARNALKETGAEWGVGLEGGLIHSAGRWMECGWIVVTHRDGREGIAATAKIMVPPKFLKQLREGETLGDICDREFNRTHVGQEEGYFGLMTNGAVTRTTAYEDGVAFALARFVQPQLFMRSEGVVGH